MREKYVETQIKKILKSQGRKVFYFKHAANLTMPTGIPDIICTIKGYSIWIEVKTLNGVQSEQQKVVQKQIEDAGGRYWLCSSVEKFIEYWNQFVKEIKNGKSTK